MGDRTSVDIFLLKRDCEENPVINGWLDGKGPQEADVPDDYFEATPSFGVAPIVVVCFYECNYGEVASVEDFLKGQKVSYDYQWRAGADYHPGTKWIRFAKDGTMRAVEAGIDEKPDLDFLEGLLEDHGKVAALSYLKHWRAEHEAPCRLGEEPDHWPEAED